MCLQKLTAKAAETIKSSPEILGAQPGPVSVLQEDFLVFFILEDQCHHAWLSKGLMALVAQILSKLLHGMLVVPS